ncbi:MAG: B12-binding domain-containing radical SAM protein [Desulfatibacillaceae bacterium]
MRIVLVYRGRYLVRQALDLETLAAVLRDRGHDVALAYDPDTFGPTDNVLHSGWLAERLSSPALLAKEIIVLGPDLVFYSVLPATWEFMRKTARLVRQRCDAPSVFGGLYATLCPERVIAASEADGLVLGEAEQALADAAEAMDRGRDPSGTPGLWWKAGGEVVRADPADPVDLAALPLPDKDLFAPWVSHAHSYPAMVSRGCPFSCTYCEETCASAVHGPGFFRRKPVDAVMAELVQARHRYPFSEVIFKDSYLSGDESWLADLTGRYTREIAAPFKCFCTITGFTERTARLLADAGCYCIEFGLQTWNEGIRKKVLGRRESNEQARRVFRLCAEYGILYDVDHMFNLPGETETDHARGALEYKALSGLNRVKVHHLVYLPKAPIVDTALATGDLSPQDAEAIAGGAVSDFYDQAHARPETADLVAGYAALYKMLSLLPGAAVRGLVESGRVRALAAVPEPAMAALQGVAAARTRDLRFAVYAREYPEKVARSIWRAITRR